MSRRDAYTAIADPTRREILTLLRDRGPLQAGEIAGRFPAVSRPSISRHLRVLRKCGVVASAREGKHRNYTLNTQPLRKVRDGWLASFATQQVNSLVTLRERAEGSPRNDDERNPLTG